MVAAHKCIVARREGQSSRWDHGGILIAGREMVVAHVGDSRTAFGRNWQS
jgi:serine/threonine protein phosphatase PrpC